MKSSTATSIIEATIPLLAARGYAGTSMRDVAEAAHIKASVIYHYFPDKAALLRAVRLHINTLLDTELDSLGKAVDARSFLRQRLDFQLRHIEHIVALLQYFMAAKVDFPAAAGGYVPQRAYRHMLEVIQRGMDEGIYSSPNSDLDAKITTHLVNGFLLEYYPHPLSEAARAALVEDLAVFIERALRYEAVT